MHSIEFSELAKGSWRVLLHYDPLVVLLDADLQLVFKGGLSGELVHELCLVKLEDFGFVICQWLHAGLTYQQVLSERLRNALVQSLGQQPVVLGVNKERAGVVLELPEDGLEVVHSNLLH